MTVVSLHDKAEIALFLSQDKGIYVYGLGDLDPFLWPMTVWYGLKDPELKAVLLLYLGQAPPTLLALSHDLHALKVLIKETLPFLPSEMYGHLSLGLRDCFGKGAQFTAPQEHKRMVLNELKTPLQTTKAEIKPLNKNHLDAILAFYKSAYPGNWFDPRMLDTGHYWGAFDSEGLLGVAGVHAYSPEYKCAALGNIATAMTCRGQGLGKALTYTLCDGLKKAGIETIGLNVASDNPAAIHVYKRLGFEVHVTFEETEMTLGRL